IFISTGLVLAFHQWQQERIKNIKLKTGLESYAQSNWKSAASNLGRYLSFCPSDIDILLKYADAQLHIRPLGQDNIQQAIAAYRTIIRADKTNKTAVKQLADLYLKIDAAPEAENVTARYMRHENDYEIQTLYAISLFRQRKFQASADMLMQVINEHPTEIKAYATMAKLAKSDVEGKYETPEHWFNEYIKNNPSSANGYILRGAYFLDESKYTKAVEELNKAENFDLSDPNTRLELVWEYIKADMPEKAKEHLKIIEENFPAFLSLWQARAEIALYQDSKEEMKDIAENGMNALKKDPWDFMPIAAELIIRSGNIIKGNEYIEKMKMNELDSAAVKWLEGLIEQAKGREYEAIKKWNIAEKMGYDSEKTTAELFNAFLRAGDSESALMLLRRKTIEQPERYKWHFLLAELAFGQQLYSEALGHSAKAMSIKPNSIEPLILNIKIKICLPSGTSQITKCENLQHIYEQLSVLPYPKSNQIEIELLKFTCAVECEQFEKAENILTELKQTYAQRIEIETAFVDLLLAKRLNEEAQTRLLELINIFPQDITPVIYLSNIYAKNDKWKESEKVILNALNRLQDSRLKRKLAMQLTQLYHDVNEREKERSFLVQTLEKMPEDVPLRKILFEFYLEDSQYIKAQSIVDEIKEIEGIDGLQWKYLQSKLWSTDTFFDNYYPQITALLQEILSNNPYDNSSRLLLASVYEKASENQLALITYRAALNQRPHDMDIKTHIIDTLFKVKEYDTAEIFLDEAIKQDYVNGKVLKLNLKNLLRQNRIPEAIEFLNNIDVPEDGRKDFNLLMACLKIKQKEYEAARKILNTVLDQEPNSFEGNSLLVELNLRTNNYDGALEICNEMAAKMKEGFVLLLRGQTYSAIGNYALAQQDYDEAARLEPNNADIFESRGLFYRSIGKFEDAFKDLEKAYQLQLSNIEIIKYMLNSLADMNNPTDVWKCQQLLKHALINYPKEPELLWYKARLLIAEEKLPSLVRAENILEDVTRNNPRFSSGWSLLAEVYLNQNKIGKAMNTILEGLKNCGNDRMLLILKAKTEMRSSPEMAVLTLEHLDQHLPDDIEIKTLLADTYLAAGQNQNAIDMLLNYELKCADSQKLKIGTTLAMCLYRTGRKEEGWNKLVQLSIAEPNDIGISAAKCEILFSEQNWEELKTEFSNMLLLHPQSAGGCLKMVQDFLLSHNQLPPSISEYLLREILKYKPDFASAILMLAINLHNNGQYDDAAQMYERLLKIDQDNKIAINNLAWVLCENNKKYQKALELADYGLKIQPDFASLRDTRGLIFYRLGEFQKAYDDFIESIQLNDKKNSSYVISLYHLGITLNRMGNDNNAYGYIQKALKLNNVQGGLTIDEVSEAQNILTFLPVKPYAADTDQ
ncbi:MAG: tetratricopeptide repeat protein, partial [Phycisphaerales bacterium]